VNKRDVRDGKDEDLTAEPEQIRAFRDTWELGIHSYLTYLRDRLLLARELLTESGSVFVQISDDNVHHVRELMDEVFGGESFVSLVTVIKTGGLTAKLLTGVSDYLLWYAKSLDNVKFHQVYVDKVIGAEGTTQYVWLQEGCQDRRIKDGRAVEPGDYAKVFAADNLTSQGNQVSEYVHDGKPFRGGWKTTNPTGLDNLARAGRLKPIGNSLMYRRYFGDFPVTPVTNVWRDLLLTGFSDTKLYVVQTAHKVIERCVIMTTDPGDLVFDPTCGSGTTAHVAEQWGRRWITCDTSRVAITLAKQRLMTAVYDYYELAHPD